MRCRHCHTPLKTPFLDLGFAPPSNAYLSKALLNSAETYYPLRLSVCTSCFLVQTEDYAAAEELFTPEYAYFSSTSSSWLAHAKNYVESIASTLDLNSNSFVIEIASNDGYLLKNFVAKKIPCLGIEPTSSTAKAARNSGVETLEAFFGESLATKLSQEGKKADLIIANNVYAHVPDINDFTKGLKLALKKGGTITLEFPHLLQLIKHCQFDTVYHEHYSYLCLTTVKKIFSSFGLRVFNVQELGTHGGSLRIYGCHEDDSREVKPTVDQLLREEKNFGLTNLSTYVSFQEKANTIKNNLLHFLIAQKTAGKKMAAYGAAAKGNTLLNYAGVKTDLISYVCDAAASKQGKLMPGSHIPIVSPDYLQQDKPDILLILPWNLQKEIMTTLAPTKEWGCSFVVAIPQLMHL
jgi:hypothetical protein